MRAERLELEAIDDREIGVDRDSTCGRRVEAEHPGRLLPGGHHRLVGDLLLAEDRVGRGQLEIAEAGVRAGETTIVVSPSASTVISAMPVGASTSCRSSSTPASRSPASASSAKASRPTAADHSHLRPEPRAGDRLVRALAAGKPFERRSADRLTGAGQRRAAHDEVEVDRADDGDPGSAHGASVTRATAEAGSAGAC